MDRRITAIAKSENSYIEICLVYRLEKRVGCTFSVYLHVFGRSHFQEAPMLCNLLKLMEGSIDDA